MYRVVVLVVLIFVATGQSNNPNQIKNDFSIFSFVCSCICRNNCYYYKCNEPIFHREPGLQPMQFMSSKLLYPYLYKKFTKLHISFCN